MCGGTGVESGINVLIRLGVVRRSARQVEGTCIWACQQRERAREKKRKYEKKREREKAERGLVALDRG